MAEQMFENVTVLKWLNYFAENMELDIKKVKILDITAKNKNLIPTVESHRLTLVFTEAGHPDIFYKMWEVGLGDCMVYYNEGSEPTGELLDTPVRDMIDRGINASAAMLIMNENARNTYKIGMDNNNFSRGSVHYVGSEIRSVILNKMHISSADNVCIISGESIAVESALIAEEGHVIAVEYNGNDRATMEENIEKFGVNNISIIDHVDENTMKGLPVPSFTMLVASASMEKEIDTMLKLNPRMEFLIYTLDFRCAADVPEIFARRGIRDVEVVQIAVSKMNSKHLFEAEPAPWLITVRA
ncbi:MAG: precorrin-6B methylase [Agathobacter sp.]|uniref:precorrin-6B methylase n=1 Tax=Agathobacter sp. TaxID=2021311 RepID=UPI002590EA82|nr:precorrin-6B methylase [Agathobacter sp.]MCR5678331.1 precorrin-6B methylase [Agathobacter sp.]